MGSEDSDIIRPCSKRKRAIISEYEETDSACSDIVVPFSKRCRVIDDEQDDSADNDITSYVEDEHIAEWIWKNEENSTKVWQYSRIPRIQKSILEFV
jgi:hypothetical protein